MPSVPSFTKVTYSNKNTTLEFNKRSDLWSASSSCELRTTPGRLKPPMAIVFGPWLFRYITLSDPSGPVHAALQVFASSLRVSSATDRNVVILRLNCVISVLLLHITGGTLP